ncbi:phage major capsid protein [Roseobacter sp. SK209-2-6]|uniref:phage major capsid protein n=1 Tax=Roseobacter sp. SK209-2-6 TaxID=388739 RepID=UPI00056862E0|nr:phage major capsid protein [Roseobacter sp. SK209-2-6]
MSKLQKLRKELEEKKAAGLALVEAAEAGGRDFTAEEETQYQAIEAEITRLQGEIKTAEDLAERRRTMTGVAAGNNRVHDEDPELTGGFAALGEFATAVHQAIGTGGTVDPRLASLVATTHQGGTVDGEGYLLPPQYRDQIWELVNDFDEFGPLIDEEPTGKREVKLGADESTPWSSAGIVAHWRGEGSKMDPSKMEGQERNVPLHELYTFALATEELLEDAPRLNNRLGKKAAGAIAWKKNQAIIDGTGAGQPLGWMKSKALIKIAKEDGQGAKSVTPKNIVKMYARLQRIPGDKPFWLINQDVLPELMFMTVGDKPIWMPSGDLANAPGGYLLGLPIRFSEFAKTLGEVGDVQLISPKGYYGARRASGLKHATSIHLFFDYNIRAFRWTFRYGGQPHLSKAVQPANGDSTRSHFVMLEKRA